MPLYFSFILSLTPSTLGGEGWDGGNAATEVVCGDSPPTLPSPAGGGGLCCGGCV